MSTGRASVLGLAATLGTIVGCGGGQVNANVNENPAEETTAVTTDLQMLREEEKLARDVYIRLHQRWEIRAFDNISQSEQRHFDRVGRLMEEMGIEDPVVSDEVGEFQDARFDELYATLVERGERSEEEALRVGVLIEELDIADIDAMLQRATSPEVRSTYELLRCGSGNHLRAFSSLLESTGEQYTPEHLSAERFEAIRTAAHQRCGRLYGGQGRGGGGHGHGGGGHGHGGGRGCGHGHGGRR